MTIDVNFWTRFAERVKNMRIRECLLSGLGCILDYSINYSGVVWY